MVKQIASMIVVVALAACGGGKKANTTPTDESGGGEDPNATQVAGDPEQVTPEQMDDINRMLDRRRGIVSRCLAEAVDAKDLPKNARGKVTIELTIEPSGKAESVKVVKNTLESERIGTCVI